MAVAVVWLIVGVNPKHAERETRQAITALQRAGFTANTATPTSLLAKAEELRAHETQTDRKAPEL